MPIELVDMDEIFKLSDVITVHTPLTSTTKNLISKGSIDMMKEGVRIIFNDNIQDKIDILPHSLHIWYEFTQPVTEFCEWLLENVYLLKNSQDIKNFIHNPTQSKDNQNNVLNLLAEKLNFSKNLKNFMFLLIEKRRIFFVEKIIDSFLKLCAQKRGEVKASLISSKELSETELENISKELSSSTSSTIKLNYKVMKYYFYNIP